MKTTIKKIISVILVVAMMCIVFVSCNITLTPSVSIGLKKDGNAGEYNESIQDLEIGKQFHGAIRITMATDKEKVEDYQVVIELPKTKDVIATREGGLRPDNQVEDASKTTLTFTIQGYKGATPQTIHFTGTPFAEGEAIIVVRIYNKEGLLVNSGYDKTVYFKYDLG
ncbi:MAG: hypothetical protein K6F14_02625 [Clostridiales bacterium]|nr:hypothetical protein [Clostridiales bacterium]